MPSSDLHAELQEWLRVCLAEEVRLPAESIDPAEPMTTYGLDSVKAITFVAEVEDHVGLELDVETLWEFTTVTSFAGQLVDQMIRTGRFPDDR